MLKLYENIKNRRIELGMTQAELAEKLGYADKSMISRIEKGQIDLPQSKIVAIAEALRVDPSELMGWDEEPSYYLNPEAAEMAKELFERPEMRVLFDASRKLTKEDLEMVTALIEKMSGK